MKTRRRTTSGGLAWLRKPNERRQNHHHRIDHRHRGASYMRSRLRHSEGSVLIMPRGAHKTINEASMESLIKTAQASSALAEEAMRKVVELMKENQSLRQRIDELLKKQAGVF